MYRASRDWLTAALVAGLLSVAGPASAADLAGNWKFKDVSAGGDTTLALLQFEKNEGKDAVKVLAAPLFGGQATVEDLRIEGSTIQFTLKAGQNVLAVTLQVPKDAAKVTALRGAILFRGRAILAEMEKTDATEVSQQDVRKMGPAGAALNKARATRDETEQEAALKQILEKHPNTSAAYSAAELILQKKARESVKDEELKAASQEVIRLGAGFGPAVERDALKSVAQTLARAPKVSPLAVDYARQLEKSLPKDAPATTMAGVLKTVAMALNKSGKAEEAKTITARLAKLEEQLDAEFLKNAVPFKPDTYAGRTAKSSRVAVVELFTGAQCPPCVSADVAFDAAITTYAPTDVVFLQYHLHIPGPDALTNADSEARQKFYGTEVRGTPTMFLNGKVTPPMGGFHQHSKDRYTALRKIVDEELETEGQGSIKLAVKRQGDKLDITANAADLKKATEKAKLRLVLIEDVVRYAGSNGQRLHHHIVRGFPGGVDGLGLKDGAAKQTVSVTLGELKKQLEDYLVEANKKRPFADDDRPLGLKHLKLVALVQDDGTKEILQAAQVEVQD